MICPACGHDNLPGQDECAECLASLQQEDVPQPDTPIRWRVMVDPISSLDPSTIPPQIVPSGTALAEGIRRMQEKNVGYLLVTGSDGKLIGIVTEQDLLQRVALSAGGFDGRIVDDVMSKEPTTVHPNEPIKHALHYMASHGTMYLPVVDDEGRPIDLLSFRRLARLIEQME
jgi:CBS domain-containing protein